MIGIYKITNPIGQVYVGQSINMELRFRHHKAKMKTENNKICRSLMTYGYENHLFEVLEICIKSDLNIKERYWQDFYNSHSENGLNSMKARSPSIKGCHSCETKKKISQTKRHNKKTIFQIKTTNSISYTTPILDTLTGVYYRTVKEAAMYNNIGYVTLYCYMNGQRFNHMTKLIKV